MPTVVRSPTETIMSSCHGAYIEITRVVHDVISYVPVRLDQGFIEPLKIVVSHSMFKGSLDSDEFRVYCSECRAELTGIEVEEQ